MEIRDYKIGDEIKILELFQSTFGKPMSEAYWKWRFIDNPENKVMIKLMWDGETLAGHYAVSPLTLKVNNEKIVAALSMTTMTHPDYSGRGIFTQLAETLYQDETKKSGLKAVLGFPNSNSHYAFIKNLKWVDLEQIPTFSIDMSQIKPSKTDDIIITNSFNESHINAQYSVTNNFKIKINKSFDYLNWRYINNPINKYEIFELKNNDLSYYAVTKVFSSFNVKNKFEVDILELCFPDDQDSLVQLLNSIKEYYKKHDLLKINTWLPLNCNKHLLLEKLGFLNSTPITYSGIRILDSNYNMLDQSKDWNYSMGDSDIY